MTWVRMLFLGDSLTTGARDPWGMSWPYYMAQLALEDGVVILPIVEARDGARTSDLVRTALPAIETAGAKEAFILIGTNDAKEEAMLPVEQSVANLRLVLSWCSVQQLRAYPLTVPLPSGFGSPGYTAAVVERIKAFNAALRARKMPRLVECEDVRETVDGVHLDVPASLEIARRAWAAVRRERTFS
jgi:lysophospholipase L1-like esterase